MSKLEQIRALERRSMFTADELVEPASPNTAPSPNKPLLTAPLVDEPETDDLLTPNMRWRARHPEKYRAYQRELMRKRRGKG